LTPLATVSELEKHLQTTFSTAPEQDQATLALELSSGEGSTVLTVPTLLLQGVNGVMLDGVSLALSDIVWTVKGQLYYGAGWPRFSVATLDIDHGYDVIPDLIKLVALDVAGRQVQNPEGLISATVGEVSRAWSTSSTPTASLTALHQTLLDRYRVF
jgi:hypothetical protein